MQEPSPTRGTTSRWAVSTLFLIGFFAIFSTTLSETGIPPLLRRRGSGDAIIGLIAAVSPLAGILFSFPVGVHADHLGRRRLLIASGVIFLSAPLLYLVIADPLWLIPVPVLPRDGNGHPRAGDRSDDCGTVPGKTRGDAGQYSSATLIGRSLAPLAGGAIISFFVFYPGLIPYRIVYLAAALLPFRSHLILMYGEDKPGR